MSELPLVFGCSTLPDLDSASAADRLLASALELGITHFDTAKAYGDGASERALGRFLRGRRDRCQVTTKYGLAPPIKNRHVAQSYARAASSKHLRSAIGGLRRTRRALRPPMFSPQSIRTGLESSLRALSTDYVDIFLLHEATFEQAEQSTVLDTLEAFVDEGKVLKFGIGSSWSKFGPHEPSISPKHRVLQFEHNLSARSGLLSATRHPRCLITHSALHVLGTATEQLRSRHDELLDRHPICTEIDASDPALLPGLLLDYSYAKYHSRKVIFSTRSEQRLSMNVAAFERCRDQDDEWRSAVRALLEDIA